MLHDNLISFRLFAHHKHTRQTLANSDRESCIESSCMLILAKCDYLLYSCW